MKGAPAAMHADAERWLSRHKGHVGRVVEVKLTKDVRWPEGTRLLRHFRCDECHDELRLELTIGAEVAS